jgi:hypothetical protein
MKKKKLTNICELRNIHTTIVGIDIKKYILTVDKLLESGISHQNIESKYEILTMQAKLQYISKNVMGKGG